MKKIIWVLFVIVAAVLLLVFLGKKTRAVTETSSINTNQETSNPETSVYTETENALGIENNSLVSFTPLRGDETLLSSMGLDLDDDHYDDEILVVRKSNRQNIYLVIGLYNPSTSIYDRMAEIETQITQLRSFSYNGIDVTGDHRTALVYQGFTENGDSVMQIYFCRRSGGNFSLVKIGDFRSDGTIFIQQSARSDTYELSQSSDASFPVWVYSSDTREGAGNLSQIQTEYDYSPTAGRYVQTRQIYVTGKNIAEKELRRIQDGTVKTFADYLNGLWYKTANSQNEVRYIYFDYEGKEVIFLVNDTQEVYTWLDSTLYTNGIYISTVNVSIENLRRRFDITLTDIDEMRVRVYDDVRMRIGEDTLWDGQYKKMNVQKDSFLQIQSDENNKATDFTARLEEVGTWYTPDGASLTFTQGSYSVSSETINENGVYFISQVDKDCVLQFNSQAKARYLSNVYIITFAQKQGESVGKKTPALVDNRDSIILHPATIMASSCYEITGKTVTINASE